MMWTKIGLGALALAAAAGQQSAAPAPAHMLSGEIADLLEANYVDPETGRRYAQMLRANAAVYAGVGDPAEIARQLTADLQAVAPDAHLRVFAPGQGGPTARPADAMAPANGAVEAAGWIAPGIAYIRLASMAGDPATTAAVERFAKDHVEARSIIIDARRNPGGGSGPGDVLFPYLFAKPTVLVNMDMRAEPDVAGFAPFADSPLVRRLPSPAGFVRRERSVLPHPTERRLSDAQIFYLTSRRTASAAETVSLALKRTRRGTIVGEPTRGAGHFGRVYPLADGFQLFLPFGRTFDPDTGQGFERTGVAPDVAVPAQDALREALRRAGVAHEAALDAAVAAAEPEEVGR